MPLYCSTQMRVDGLTIDRLKATAERLAAADGLERTWQNLARAYIVKGVEKDEDEAVRALVTSRGVAK